MQVNILTLGPASPNARAFLQPITINSEHLQKSSIRIKLFKIIKDDITECDVLIIDSKFFQSWYATSDTLSEMYRKLEIFSLNTKVLFFDTMDSAGYILGNVLPYVDSYYKHQILVDKNEYLEPMYGRRSYSHFYHQQYNVNDSKEHEDSIKQVSDPRDLDKINVFWNTGLANYSFLGEYMAKIYKRLPLKFLVRYPKFFTNPENNRVIDIQCRINTSYNKDSVAYQRKLIAKYLSNRLQTKKLNRYSFYRELKISKIVLSPFGLGEITLKDFETFISGAILMKPDMSHMETWPNFFEKDKTYLSFNWDLSNLEEKIDFALKNYENSSLIAFEGQKRYKHYVSSKPGQQEIVSRFKDIIQANT